ncbi:MAG: acyltransferase family protein [Clostridia bacterium]|nr:acyltransferase family protein [Clostridia bacterium]
MTQSRAVRRNVYLDLFKLFLCYLVIAIHLAHETYWHFPLYRLAVPMFFLISGYFNYSADRERLLHGAHVFLKRTVHYMLIGFSVYIVFDFIGCFINGNGVGYYFTTLFYEDFLLEFFFLNRPITYTGAQLWFLIALFVVSLIHLLLVKLDRLHLYRIIIPVCFLIYFFFAGYMYLLQDTDMPIRYTRNAFFFGLPNFALGFTLAKYRLHEKTKLRFCYLLLGIACFFLQIAEYHLVKTPNCSLEMYVTGVCSAVLLLLFFLSIPHAECPLYYRWVGKNAPFYIYILHMAVAVVLSSFVSFDHLMVKCAWVWLISFVIYEIFYLLSRFKQRLQQKKPLSE